MKRRFEDFAGVTLLIVCALAPLLPVMRSEIPARTDAISQLAPWRAEGAVLPESSVSSLACLEGITYLPAYAYIAEHGNSLSDLLWNPLEERGRPFFAMWYSRCLSPFTLPFYVLPLGAALTVSAVLKLLAAGLAAYYAARRLAFHPPFALVCAIAHQWSAGLLLAAHHPASDAAPWFPLFLLALERIALGQRWYWPFAALVIALSAIGGGAETFVQLVLTGLVYIGVRLFRAATPKTVFRTAAVFLGSAVAGLLAIAIQACPYVEYLRYSYLVPSPDSRTSPIEILTALLLPTIDRPDSDAAGLFHLGPVLCPLLVFWFALRRTQPGLYRRRIDSIVVTASACALAATALPLSRGLAVWSGVPYLVALTGVAAAESWLELEPHQCNLTLRRLLPAWAALGIVMVGLFLVGSEGAATGGIALATYAVVAGLTLLTLVQPASRVLGYGLVVLTLTSLGASNVTRQPSAPAAALYPDTSFIEALRVLPAPIGGSPVIERWPLAANGIESIATTALRTISPPADPGSSDWNSAPSFVMDANQIAGLAAGDRAGIVVKEVFPDRYAALAPVAPSAEAFATTAFLRGEESSFSLDSAISAAPVLVLPPPLVSPGLIRVDAEVSEEALVVVRRSWYPGWRVKAEGFAAPAGLLGATGRLPNAEGARLGSRPASNTDGSLSVLVGPGKGTIEFAYKPASFRAGLALSALGVLLIAGGFVWLAVRPRRR